LQCIPVPAGYETAKPGKVGANIERGELLTETDRVVIVTNRFMELVVEGTGCAEQAEVFFAAHMNKVEEQTPYEFLFFAKEWFDTRGFSTEVRPMEHVKGFKRLMIKLSLYMLRRRSGGV